jgi:3-oxoacyl-ACP reductase-like protein
MGDYLFYSLMGICAVFFALVLLMCIIKILTWEPAKAEVADAAAAPAAEAAVVDKPLAPGSAGDVKLYDTDPRTAAMIMAIVADELKKPVNELRFISIREVKE